MTGAFKVPDSDTGKDSPADCYVIVQTGNGNVNGRVIAKCKDTYDAALIKNMCLMWNFINQCAEGFICSSNMAESILGQIRRDYSELRNSGSC